MEIGVIGIRSKHLLFFREALSRLYPEGQHRITHIWGYDAPELLGDWTDLISCPTPEILIDAVDAVIIALRDGTQHAALAQMAIEAGKPVFVDKPFTCSPQQAGQLAALCAEKAVLCTGGSTVCFTKEVQQLKHDLPQQPVYTLSYQADPFTPFGGWYFYGSHLTDLCVTVFGGDWQSVQACQKGDRITAVVTYPGFQVTLRTSRESQPLLLHAGRDYILDDHGCYVAGMAHFINAIEGKEKSNAAELVRSVALMDAIFTSLREGLPYPG